MTTPDRREVEVRLAEEIGYSFKDGYIHWHDRLTNKNVKRWATASEEEFWNALVERELRERWIALPNEQGWWWHWNEDRESVPFMYSVLASLSGAEPRYFIAFPDSRWCDLIGGVWCRAKAPAPPESEGK